MDWYRVQCNDSACTLDVRPPGSEPWTARFAWSDIVRVCFEVGDFMASDTFYVFVEGREASYAIPSEGVGASELAGCFERQGLFPVEVLLEAMKGEDGAITCFPPMNVE